MGKSLSQIVNSGLVGEPEHIVFQILETLEKIELSDITHINHNSDFREPIMPDDMYYVLNNMNHRCYIEVGESGEKILHLE